MAQWLMLSVAESFARDCDRRSRRSEGFPNWNSMRCDRIISLGTRNSVTVCGDCPTESLRRFEFSTGFFRSVMRYFHDLACSKPVYKTHAPSDVLGQS